jgi:hypothetical protein
MFQRREKTAERVGGEELGQSLLGVELVMQGGADYYSSGVKYAALRIERRVGELAGMQI